MFSRGTLTVYKTQATILFLSGQPNLIESGRIMGLELEGTLGALQMYNAHVDLRSLFMRPRGS